MRWRPFTFARYRKAVVAAAALIVEVGAIWADAPEWFLAVVAAAGWVLTVWVPNEPVP